MTDAVGVLRRGFVVRCDVMGFEDGQGKGGE
jgi:hypothetical protein